MAKTQRLDKTLANMGYGTRKEIKKIIMNGRVKVNNEVIKDESKHINIDIDKIILDDIEIKYIEYEYIMLNKPSGYVSATYDPREKTVLELLDIKYRNMELFPVGRLDKDTEGLLMMTNDGKLAHNLLSPKKHVSKVYYAEIDDVVDKNDIDAFTQGVTLDDGYETMPAKLKIIESGEISKIELEIQEGKFHQVKRMFNSRGKNVTYLKRIKMGNLELDNNLSLGEYRKLTEEELKNIVVGE